MMILDIFNIFIYHLKKKMRKLTWPIVPNIPVTGCFDEIYRMNSPTETKRCNMNHQVLISVLIPANWAHVALWEIMAMIINRFPLLSI